MVLIQTEQKLLTVFSFEKRAISRKPEAPQALPSLPVKCTSKLVSSGGQLRSSSTPGPGANPPGASAAEPGICTRCAPPVPAGICQEHRWLSSSTLPQASGKATVLSAVPAKQAKLEERCFRGTLLTGSVLWDKPSKKRLAG